GRIFEPLGMTSTQYLDDTTRVVPKRATAYSPGSGGFRVNMSDWNQTGDGAVQTTVEDLARWDENFYAPKVGDARMLQAMQTAGRLNTSKTHEDGLRWSMATCGGLNRVSDRRARPAHLAHVMRLR